MRFGYSIIFYLSLVGYTAQIICIGQRFPLHILFMVDKFPYEPRKYIDNQIVDLMDAGHEVYVLADRVGPHNDYLLAQKYHFLDNTFYGDTLPSDHRKFDIIYCQFGGKGNKALKMLKKKKVEGKLIVCFRGGDATKKIVHNPHIYDALFKKADLLFPICNHFKDILIAHGCDPKKIVVHYSSIDADSLSCVARKKPSGNNPIKIITVARLVEYKGLEDSIQAVARVIKAYPNIEYEIIGEGIERERLDALIKSLNLQEHVKLVGYLNFEKILERLYASHIFLFTPFTPSYGEQDAPVNTIKEAMLTGLPVISTYHGGIPELVQHGITGYLVAEKNISAIAKTIMYVIQHPDEWPFLGKAGAEYVKKKFDKKIINKNLISIFYKVLKQ